MLSFSSAPGRLVNGVLRKVKSVGFVFCGNLVGKPRRSRLGEGARVDGCMKISVVPQCRSMFLVIVWNKSLWFRILDRLDSFVGSWCVAKDLNAVAGFDAGRKAIYMVRGQ
ncbi:hypothetical protein V6N13_079774 [Hibiscus sabdariffa]